MRIVLSGPPSVGKTTQGRLLSAALGVPHVSSGAIIRDRAREGNFQAQRLLQIVSDGSLAPSAEIIALIVERLSEGDCAEGFILDGFPRKAEEARALLATSLPIDGVLRLVASPNTLVTRVEDRARQSSFFRADDDPSVFPRRIAIFNAETELVVAEFVRDGILVEDIDASRPAPEVHRSIMNWVEQHSLIDELADAPRLFA